MSLRNRHRDLLLFERSLALQIQAATRTRQGTHHLALAIGAVVSQQLMGQFHGSRAAVNAPTTPVLF